MSDQLTVRSGHTRIPRNGLKFKSEGRTHQSFKEDCDINTIMNRYQQTGTIHHQANGQPKYGDFIHATDYLSACNQVLEARQTFDALPARVRARMHNDPGELLDFMADPNNREEGEQLGLFLPTPTPEVKPPKVGTPAVNMQEDSAEDRARTKPKSEAPSA